MSEDAAKVLGISSPGALASRQCHQKVPLDRMRVGRGGEEGKYQESKLYS